MDLLDKTGFLQLTNRHVHRQAVAGVSLVSPLTPLRAGTIEHPPSQLDDLTGFLSLLDKLCRHYQPTGRMPPPDQNLGPHDFPCVDQDDRLVVQLELPCLQSFGELGTLSGSAHHLGMKVFAVKLDAALSVFLRRIQRQIRAPEQFGEVEGYFVAAADDHTNARRSHKLLTLDNERATERLHDPLGEATDLRLI